MRVEYVTLAVQWLILFAVGYSARSAWQTWKSTKRTWELIGLYRREIEWLVARIEALEGKANGRQREVDRGRRSDSSQ